MYKNKYLKYKQKYLNHKGGSLPPIIDEPIGLLFDHKNHNSVINILNIEYFVNMYFLRDEKSKTLKDTIKNAIYELAKGIYKKNLRICIIMSVYVVYPLISLITFLVLSINTNFRHLLLDENIHDTNYYINEFINNSALDLNDNDKITKFINFICLTHNNVRILLLKLIITYILFKKCCINYIDVIYVIDENGTSIIRRDVNSTQFKQYGVAFIRDDGLAEFDYLKSGDIVITTQQITITPGTYKDIKLSNYNNYKINPIFNNTLDCFKKPSTCPKLFKIIEYAKQIKTYKQRMLELKEKLNNLIFLLSSEEQKSVNIEALNLLYSII